MKSLWDWVVERVLPSDAVALKTVTDMRSARTTRTVQAREMNNHALHDAMRDPATRIYGHRATIHGSTQLDVEVNAAGVVVAVWFRCQALPFRQSFASGQRAVAMREMRSGLPRLVAVELLEGQ